MSHITLYRKWRPKTFDDVKGQDATVRILKTQVAIRRIGHAYLFCGTRGTGKTSVAKILAMAINCERPVDGSPCYECPTCKALSEPNFDILEFDAASNSGVDSVREIRSEVDYLPSFGRYKVYIIDEAHMLTTEAHNALLKTLEEPPEHVVFILATTELNSIPVTIRSRCQRYDFKRISDEVIADRLQEVLERENIPMETKAVEYIANLADGALRDALSILEQCISYRSEGELTLSDVERLLGRDGYRVFHDMYQALLARDILGLRERVHELMREGRTCLTLMDEWADYIKNLAMYTMAKSLPRFLTEDEMECVLDDAATMSMDEYLALLDTMVKIREAMKWSDNRKMIMEIGLVRMLMPREGDDPSALAARMDSLERRLDNLKYTAVPALPVTEQVAESPAEPEETSRPQDEGLVNRTEEAVRALSEDLKNVIGNWKGFTDRMEQTVNTGMPVVLRNAQLNVRDNTLVLVVGRDMELNVLKDSEELIHEAMKEYFNLDIAMEIYKKKQKQMNFDLQDLIHMEIKTGG